MNTRRFYGSRNPQNSDLISSSESEDEIENILSEDSDSYCPSELSSNDFLNQIMMTFHLIPMLKMIKEVALTTIDPLVHGVLLMQVTGNNLSIAMTVAFTDFLECKQQQWNLLIYTQ